MKKHKWYAAAFLSDVQQGASPLITCKLMKTSLFPDEFIVPVSSLKSSSTHPDVYLINHVSI